MTKIYHSKSITKKFIIKLIVNNTIFGKTSYYTKKHWCTNVTIFTSSGIFN